MSEDYERKARVGQAMNMAHAYILARANSTSMSITEYGKELRDKTQVFKAWIDEIQQSYANAEEAINNSSKQVKEENLYDL